VQSDLFREICEAAPDGILVVDNDGRIVTANHKAEAQFGYPRDELVGQHVDMLLPEALREKHVHLRQSYAAHSTSRPMGTGLDLRARHADGHEFPVEISLSPVGADGQPMVIAIIRDVTDRRRLEAEREELRAIAETDRERNRIAMDLHDGIIQSIYAVGLTLEGAVEDIERDPARAAAQMNRSIDQLSDAILDLRGYILDLRPARYGGNLAESLKSLVAEFRANTLIESTLEIDAALPTLPVEQETAIFHIAQEALANARKHARATTASVTLSSDDGFVKLQVTDNGAGFDTAVDLPEEHNGLRNMQARGRACGGDLRVESSSGQGTSIQLRIPVRRLAGEPR
jgi:PAS domain S-box-containing protein